MNHHAIAEIAAEKVVPESDGELAGGVLEFHGKCGCFVLDLVTKGNLRSAMVFPELQ